MAGEEIPLAARIVAIADAYDAITSSRPYRRVRSHAEAQAIVRSEAGTHFDPRIVEAFLRVIGEVLGETEAGQHLPAPAESTAEPAARRAA